MALALTARDRDLHEAIYEAISAIPTEERHEFVRLVEDVLQR